MAMRVPQPRHQQLSAVADDADTGIFGRDCGERSRLPDGAVRNHNCAGLDHTRRSEARVSDYICAPHDDALGHRLAPLHFGSAADATPEEHCSARQNLYTVSPKNSPRHTTSLSNTLMR